MTSYTPSIDEVLAIAPKLNEWASMAAHAYGTYSGINEAIKTAPDKSSPIVGHANHYRQMSALLCVMRTFATIDRDAEISLQSVHRYLKNTDAVNEIANAYAAAAPRSKPNLARAQTSVDRYNVAYAKIVWRAIGKLQSFRNAGIAHIQWTEIKRFVTYGELADLVAVISLLAGELTLMTSGLNNWPSEHQEAAHDDARRKWQSIFAADASGKIDY